MSSNVNEFISFIESTLNRRLKWAVTHHLHKLYTCFDVKLLYSTAKRDSNKYNQIMTDIRNKLEETFNIYKFDYTVSILYINMDASKYNRNIRYGTYLDHIREEFIYHQSWYKQLGLEKFQFIIANKEYLNFFSNILSERWSSETHRDLCQILAVYPGDKYRYIKHVSKHIIVVDYT